jgi:hypothetical protein
VNFLPNSVNDSSEAVRTLFIAINHIQPTKSELRSVLPLLGAGNRLVRRAAATTLAQIWSTDVTHIILPLLAEPDQETRFQATLAVYGYDRACAEHYYAELMTLQGAAFLRKIVAERLCRPRRKPP